MGLAEAGLCGSFFLITATLPSVFPRFLPQVVCAVAAACVLVFPARAADAGGGAESLIFSGEFDPVSDQFITGPTFVNDVLGWSDYFNAGYRGASTEIGNVEAGHIWFGHEVFNREPWATTGFTTFQNTNALNELDYHATMVGHVLAGTGYVATNSSYTYAGLGMAPQAALVSGSIATEFSPTYLGSFNTTYDSVIAPYKAFFTGGSGVAKADVINSSWGGYDPAAIGPEAVALDGLAAENSTVAFVASAGNSDISPVGNPGSDFNNIAVGSVGGSTFLVPSEFSSRGLVDFYNPVSGVLTTNARVAVDIAAPGELLFLAAYLGDSGSIGASSNPYIHGMIQEPPPTGQYFVNMDGTSFSSPIVAGGVALLKDVAKTHPFLNLNADTNALDTRVVKSVLMSGALETPGWDNGQSASGGVVATTQALDAATGAGALNLTRSTTAYFFGTTDVAGSGGGVIAGAGWDFGTLGLGTANDYAFGGVFTEDVEMTVSLNWFAGRTFDNNTDLGANLSFADLNLEVWEMSGGAFSAPVASSLTTYNNAEFLRVDLKGGKNYGLRVTLAGMVFDTTGAVASESYGLSWIGSSFNTLYWNPNGTNAVSPAGTWSGVSAAWGTNSAGTGGAVYTTTSGLDQLVFSAGTNATGAGTVTVDGPQIARSITVRDGALNFVGTNAAFVQINSGGLVVASTADGNTTFGATLPVMVSGSQTWANESAHRLEVAGGVSGNGDLALASSSTGAIVISGAVNHAGALSNSGTGTATNTISGVIGTNVTGVTQDSVTSALVLNGSAPNLYTGDTTVRTGMLVVDFANAASPTNLVSADSRLVLGGNGGPEGGALRVLQKSGVATSQTFDGTLVAAGASSVEAVNVGGSAGAGLDLNLGTIARTNSGTLVFVLPDFGAITTANSNVNGILGPWATVGRGSEARYATVVGGAVAAAAGTSAADAGQITDTTGTANYDLASGGALGGGASFNTLRYTGAAAALSNNFSANGLLNAGSGALDVAGGVTVGDSRNLVVTAASASLRVSDGIADNGGGPSSVTKSGAGIVLFSGDSTYTGSTWVAEGELRVDGNIAASATTFVASGATLSGSGTVGNLTLQSGGTGSPGNSPGTQTVAGNFVWTGGASYNWHIYNAAGTAGQRDGWDLYSVTGQLDLSALSLGSKFNINLWSLSAVVPADVSGNAINFDPFQNYTWTIVAAAGGVTGFDASFFNINTGAVNGTQGFANATYGGSFSLGVSGNNLNLTYTKPVPEPGTWVAGALMVAAAVLAARRRLVASGNRCQLRAWTTRM